MNKKFRAWVVISLIIIIFSSSVTSINVLAASKTTKLNKYRKTAKIIENKNGYSSNVIDASGLTCEKIAHRKHTIIIERCIGKVSNKNKDGKILNPSPNKGDYISYKRIKCKKGDIVITYFLWNPENNISDDIIARWDYVIKK